MVRRLRPVELEFAESAPLRLVFTGRMSAPPEAVHRALAEDVAGWPQWFSAISSAQPTADGGGRDVVLRGGVRFSETILATRPAERYTYRIDTVNAPGFRALLEDWQLTPHGHGGTRVSWTMAADAALPARTLLRVARPGMARTFRDALRALDRRLSPTQPGRS